MAGDYFEIDNADQLDSLGEFQLSRAIKLHSAANEFRDVEILSGWKTVKDGELLTESLVIDIECDGVPENNDSGIQYRERLELRVHADDKKLVEVLPLRRSFPVLMHQNDTPPGEPLNLCLYFESPMSVLRTWTPQSFLRRIQWWLESSAKGILHAFDQPVEQLFFNTIYELILPRDYHELRKRDGVKFTIVVQEERPNKGITFFLKQVTAATDAGRPTVEMIDIEIPTMVHGRIMRSPVDLGGLDVLLAEKGINLLDILKTHIQGLVGGGIAFSSEIPSHTVFLLSFSISREEGAEPEEIETRAYLSNKSYLDIGVTLGALLRDPQDGTYYADLMQDANSVDNNEWHDLQISPMDVLQCNDQEKARFQSGVLDSGPEKGVLVGAGSLGAALWEIWARSGWGQWLVIDNDHIKPHNITRHIAYDFHIGLPKVNVVSTLNDFLFEGASTLEAKYLDVCDPVNCAEVKGCIAEADLVIDVSTDVDYPRISSTWNDVGRHLSIYVTPQGGSAVLMLEDANRVQRLRTLEAQYFRALINEEWADNHFGTSSATFWSGASCRDVSTVMAYSKILTHAGNLAEQVQRLVGKEEAFVGVWTRNLTTGNVDFHEIDLHPEKSYDFDPYTIYVDEGVIQKLYELREMHLPNETGGILLGYFDLNLGMVMVVDCLPAPADSHASATMFERGTSGLSEMVSAASDKTAGIVRYVGEWHSHPDGYTANPSNDDLLQLSELAIGMHEDGLPAMVLIVGEHSMNVVQGRTR